MKRRNHWFHHMGLFNLFANHCLTQLRCLLQVLIGSVNSVRYLNLHEHQSKELMKNYGVTVQEFKMATTPEEAGSIAKELGVVVA